MTAQNGDPVVERHEKALESARRQVEGAIARRDRSVGGVVRSNGTARRATAMEVAARNVEIDALRAAAERAESALGRAREDQPRREGATRAAERAE